MNPIPCAHCGVNYMRTTPDPEAPKLCNNCLLKEERRTPQKGKPMDTVDILIKCPIETQIEIEEICINRGGDFSKYFLDLHHASILNQKEHRERGGKWDEDPEENDSEKSHKSKGKKKND